MTDKESDATETESPVVLAVDNEKRVVQAFELWLNDDYSVETATSGQEALNQMHDGVDVVLLDRHMPGLSGEDVLEGIRKQGYDCHVAMVTAVDPDFDIVEMPFDYYVSKPVDEPTLQSIITELLELREYEDKVSELYRVCQKITTLEAKKPRQRLNEDERYQELLEARETLQATTRELVTTREMSAFEDIFEAKQ
ncbi:response regulator [Halovenus rubra]|uniref:Response regulator n=2 Tax=Halovenus rubra TaxID=869890 RepID=A0ACC7E2S6_9EURY|nr:response regulator [Halovenus rubra]